MKFNNKGFTLIELLATIVILGLISTITIVAVTGYLEKSKEKGEESFYHQLEGYVESYIALYGGELDFNNDSYDNIKKCHKQLSGDVCESTILKSEYDTTLKSVLDSVVGETVKNPKTEKVCGLSTGGVYNEELIIYRDTDYVYCFTIEPKNSEASCISKKISTCEKIYKPNSNASNCPLYDASTNPLVGGYCSFD